MSTDKQSIVIDYDFAASPARVWRALTDSDLLARWLMANDFAPVVGHKFNFKAQPTPGWDGVVYCEVLEVDAPHRLRYSWSGGTTQLAKYGHALDTTVTWTLSATATGTRLRLEHAGFTPANAFAYDAMSKGWAENVAKRLQEVVATL